MPGFNIENTSQNNKDHLAEFRRKHRWRVTMSAGGGGFPGPAEFLYLKTAARPQFKFLPAEFHHDQEKAFLAGKQEWEPVELVFYDAVGDQVSNDIAKKLYDWVLAVCDLGSAQVALPSEYKKELIIESTDASGEPDETWTLKGAWPESTNWNNLDYQANDIQEVNVTVRYDRALRS